MELSAFENNYATHLHSMIARELSGQKKRWPPCRDNEQGMSAELNPMNFVEIPAVKK